MHSPACSQTKVFCCCYSFTFHCPGQTHSPCYGETKSVALADNLILDGTQHSDYRRRPRRSRSKQSSRSGWLELGLGNLTAKLVRRPPCSNQLPMAQLRTISVRSRANRARDMKQQRQQQQQQLRTVFVDKQHFLFDLESIFVWFLHKVGAAAAVLFGHALCYAWRRTRTGARYDDDAFAVTSGTMTLALNLADLGEVQWRWQEWAVRGGLERVALIAAWACRNATTSTSGQ